MALKLSIHANGHTFLVSGVRYLSPSQPKAVSIPHAPECTLATVFTLSLAEEQTVTSDWMRAAVHKCRNEDDVFTDAFLAAVIFQGAETIKVDADAREYLAALGTGNVSFLPGTALLPGPYAVIDKQLRDVWKLIDDSNSTCMATLKPHSGRISAFETLHESSPDGQFSCFAIPSRLKTQNAHHLPLAGMRLVVKDNLHLQGVKTSLGNRAFYNTFPPPAKTAECIMKLIERGAAVVGKAKMTSFAGWEEPIEHVEYQAPWNPRADRHQSPGGSSSGSASAIAAYEWLDIAIGTDTWGSITRPAQWCGCFGLRPTMGTVPAKGIEPLVSEYDTPGILATDLQKCKTVAAEWLDCDGSRDGKLCFTSLIWPIDFWSIMPPDQVDIARKFVSAVQKALGISCDEISYKELWNNSPPPEAGHMNMDEFINPATAVLCYDAYHNSDELRAKHFEKFKVPPYTTPRNQKIWELGKTMSKAQRDEGFHVLETYNKWFHGTILTGRHSNALTIMPLEPMAPRYRDRLPEFRRPPQDGIHALAIAAVVKSPALAIPIGEIPYQSAITDREEKLPMSVALMSRPGTDIVLIDAATRSLETAGLPTTLKTGRFMFEQ